MPLNMVSKGSEVVLKNIFWGEKLKRKLQDMGLTPGVKLKVVSDSGKGPVVIDVRGTRLALGRGILNKIYVDGAA
ncbi:MAG: ferrous iron transport protein A [Firmicutes bacterium]|jgi:Fe2+ transport system protein FeoA|nr:ferrous iron transport protein A [Bacillota bacterium]